MSKETPDLSGLLGNLLSNPGALSALSGILGNLGGAASQEGPHTEEMAKKEDEGIREKEPPSLPAMLPFSEKGGRYHDREGLLGALRPYLSPKRCQALEGACKLLEVIDLFRTQRKGYD